MGVLLAVPLAHGAPPSAQPPASPTFHDAHYHPTDYIQQETALPEFLDMMGDTVERVALMGIPLQQKWDWFESGDRPPDYYLRSDAALYYYPFVDAMVAEAVLALPPEQQERFDPMITGFNPTDMYATDHIRRVLRLYPGVFSGIGEFSIHKEVVTPKTVGHTASLRNPALDRILEFGGGGRAPDPHPQRRGRDPPARGRPSGALRPVHRGGPAPIPGRRSSGRTPASAASWSRRRVTWGCWRRSSATKG